MKLCPTRNKSRHVSVKPMPRFANQFCKRMGLSPTDSAIVSVKVDGKEANLMNAGVTASIRNEALRLSFHLYNCEKDVDSVINAIMDF